MADRTGSSRRRFLGNSLALATSWELKRAAWALGFAPRSAVCRLAADEQTVGPYYVAEELLRSDIREGKPGIPLFLRLVVMDARTCTPLPHAAVDVWHCDALGLYAGFTKLDPTGFGPGGPGGPPAPGTGPRHPGPPPGFDPQHPGNRPGPPEGEGPPPPMKTTDELTFLRGIQFTDERGRAEFATIFPGFYMGRTNHIHFKVREGGRVVSRKNSAGAAHTYLEGHTSHIGQVFFPEEKTVGLMQREPYRRHEVQRTTQNQDGIFSQQHGAASIATLRPTRSATPGGGLTAELVVAVDPSRTPAEVGMGPPPPA